MFCVQTCLGFFLLVSFFLFLFFVCFFPLQIKIAAGDPQGGNTKEKTKGREGQQQDLKKFQKKKKEGKNGARGLGAGTF